MFLPEPLRPLGLNAAVFALPMQADFSARSVWQFACPGAGEGHGAKAQAGIEMLRPLVGERHDDDRAAAGSAQTIDERRDDPGDHAPAPGGRKREEVLDRAHPVGRGGVAAIGDRNAALNREVEMIGVAFAR